jgi:nitroreductase
MINGIEMLDLILRRQSDRKYNDRPIETEKLERILEAGRIAPSACNGQPWKFVAVTDRKLIADIADAATEKLSGMNKFSSQAAVIIAIVREKSNLSSRVGGAVKRKDYSYYDIGMAIENICLQAAAEGIGSCILGWFNESTIKSILQIPRSKRVALLITLGYSEGELRPKKRKEKGDTISYNKY